MALDPSTLDSLLQSGQITPDQHAQFTGMINPVTPAPAIVGQDLSAPAPMATPTGGSVIGAPGGIPLMNAGSTQPANGLTGVQAGTGFNLTEHFGDEKAEPPSSTSGSTTPGMPGRGPVDLHSEEKQTTEKRAGPTAAKDQNSLRSLSYEEYLANQEALTTEAKIRANKANEELEPLQRRADEAMTERIDFEKKVEDKRENIRKIEEKYNSMEVDPKHAWGDGITSSKIMAAIGLTLGALGSAISGKDQQSGVVNIMQKIVENDIRAQEQNIAKTGKSLEMARGGLRDFFDETKDMVAARDMEMTRQLTTIAKKYERVAATSQDAAIRAKALGHYNDLMGKVAALSAQTDANITTKIYKDDQQMAKTPEAAPEGTMKDQQLTMESLASFKRIKELRQQVKTGKLAKAWEFIGKKTGDLSPEQQEMSNKLAGVVGQVTRAMFSGQASESDRKIVEQSVPDLRQAPETFDHVIDKMIMETERKLDGQQKQWRAVGKNLPDWRGLWSSTYEEDSPTWKFTEDAAPTSKKK